MSLPTLKMVWSLKNFQRIARFLIKFAPLLFILAVALTAFSVYRAKSLKIDSNYMAFLPDDLSVVKNLKQVIKKTGGFGNYKVVIEGAPAEIRRAYAKELSKRFQPIDWVDYVEHTKGWDKIEKSKFLLVGEHDLAQMRDRIKNTIQKRKNPLFIDLEDSSETDLKFEDIEQKYQRTSFGSPYFEDAKDRYTAIQVWPKGTQTDIGFARRSLKDLQDALATFPPGEYHEGLQASIGGSFRNKIDEYSSLVRDIGSTGGIAFGGVFFLILIFYRRVFAALSIIIPLVFGTLWCFGAATFLVPKLNLLTVFLVAILFGLGVDYGIYLFSRFAEERSNGKSLEDAIATTLFETGRATLSAAVTTALAFFVLIFMRIKGFQEFGLLTFTSIAILFCTFLFFSPVIWALGERLGLKVKAPGTSKVRLLGNPLVGRKVVALGVMIAIASAVAVPFTGFEYDYGKLRSKTNTYWGVSRKIHYIFPLSKSPAIAITDTLDEARALVKEIRKKIPDSRTIDTVKSIVDFLPESLEPKRKILKEIDELLRANRQFMEDDEKEKTDTYLPYLDPPDFALEDLPRRILRYFRGLDNPPGYLVFIYDKVRLSDGRWAIEYADDIKEFKTEKQSYHPAEGSVIFAATLVLMQKEAVIAFGVMLLGIYSVLVFNFKSFLQAFHVFVPLLMGILMTFGAMWLFGLKLNMFNLVIFPILLGIGIDSSLHLYHRFHEEGSDLNALKIMFRSTGSSLLLASMTTIIGFASMVPASHQGLASIGLVALTGMACLLISSLGFYPAYLYLVRKLKM